MDRIREISKENMLFDALRRKTMAEVNRHRDRGRAHSDSVYTVKSRRPTIHEFKLVDVRKISFDSRLNQVR
jgi:hypothetical protein